MASSHVKKIKREDSVEDFEFFDAEGDLDIDIAKASLPGEIKTNKFGLVISTLCALVEERGLVPSIPSKMAIAATAVGAVAGSLLGGPPGLAIGLMTGAVMAYRTSPKRTAGTCAPIKTSIRQILSQMTLEQKKELIKELLGCLKQSNIKSLMFEILRHESVRNMAMEILSGFLRKKMGISLIKPK